MKVGGFLRHQDGSRTGSTTTGSEAGDVKSDIDRNERQSSVPKALSAPPYTNGAPVSRRWPRHRRTVGLARTLLSETLARWSLGTLNDAAAVVLSELLTNAVCHAHTSPGREIETHFLLVQDGVRIEVHDSATQLPRLRPVDLAADDGRGLLLVAALADGWGVSERIGVGKAVWAVLAVRGTGADS
ncbi:ATP-binding protein [Streptomyces sp. NBC_01210]|uniref:ATP-binding protein n=1 Tax=Streptomyces sp. NBC_01210 TaxID=2903774 RepID=UPI002E0EFA59